MGKWLFSYMKEQDQLWTCISGVKMEILRVRGTLQKLDDLLGRACVRSGWEIFHDSFSVMK